MEHPSHADDLAKCVQCGLCLTACPTYTLTGIEGYSPRGRIAAIRTSDRTQVFDEYLDTCLGCRACEAVCPSGVPYGRILEHARGSRPPVGGPVRRAAERVGLWVLSRPWRLAAASFAAYPLQKIGLLDAVPAARGMPPLKLRTVVGRMGTNYVPPDGTPERGQVVLFTGCVQDTWGRDVHWATVGVLTGAGYRVRVPRGQVCCGALHAHGGRLDDARALARRNLDPLERYEGTIVVNAAGCGAKLKEYGELLEGDARAAAVARRCKDVTEVLTASDVRGLRPSPPPGISRVAVHDPCHLNFVQRVHEQPRTLLRAAGYEVVDVPDGGRCCGAAGSYSVQHPDFARPLRDSKLEACRSVDPDAVAVANPGCLFWMASGTDVPPMYHPIQLVAMAVVNRTEIA